MDQGPVLAGRYALSGLLGRGGMAEVHRARDLRLDRDVAVKVLRTGQAADATFRGRFRREALAVASLNHPRIVAVFDAGEAVVDGVELPFIVMQYVEGRTLADLVRDGSGLPAAEALEMTAQVLDALEHAHAGGIVHRDIKPANVMVAEHDGVKVMDFGIARAAGVDGVTLTGTAMVVGTAEYLSPEQARGRDVDARSDLYSTGCLLYELLTGRPPFTGGSALSVAWKHVQEEPLPPSAHLPGLPAGCDAVVLRALSKEREDRYQDAAAMRAAVRTALTAPEAPTESRPLGVPAGPAVESPAAPRRRGRVRARRAAVVAAVVVVAAALAGVHLVRSQHSGGTPSALVVAPDLRGESVPQARRSAQDAHLRVGGMRVGGCAPVRSERRVCEQEPAPGTRIAAGTGISLRISPRGSRAR